jgi:fibro-slime domain-containing protein
VPKLSQVLVFLMLAGAAAGGCASISEAPGDGIDGGSKVDVRVNLDKASKIVGNPMDCGNSKIDTGEDCDDGNKDSGDGCSDMCQREAGWVCTTPGQKCDPPRCGDANLTDNESCDDNNTTSGDGCSADCKAVEPGWLCRVPGKRCTPLCGDGKLTGTEICDDGNTTSGDGCSSTCQLEPGASCKDAGKACDHAVCGNGKVEATESCDAGPLNGLFIGDGSGCSKSCTKEPNCRDGATTRACDVKCGDGNKDDSEDCDDGNLNDHDGCSHDCKLESGFMCSTMKVEDKTDCTDPVNSGKKCLELPVTFRDFKSEKETGGHPDFFYLGAGSGTSATTKRVCVPNSGGPAKKNDSTARCWDLAQPTLGADGKPVFNASRMNGNQCDCQFTDWSHDTNGGHVPGYGMANSPLNGLPYVAGPDGHPQYKGLAPVLKDKNSFAQWWTDSDLSSSGPTPPRTGWTAVGKHVVGSIELADTGDGSHYRFTSFAHAVYGGFFPLDPPASNFPIVAIAAPPGAPGVGTTVPGTGEHLNCNIWPYWYSSTAFGDGAGCKGDQYVFPPSITTPIGGMWVTGMQGWRHNSWYSTEVRDLFVFNGPFSLQFYGDDELFIFINGKLAVDLGGVHQRLPGRVDVDAKGIATIIEGGEILPTTGEINTCPGVDPYTMLPTNATCAGGTCDCRTRTLDLGLKMGAIHEIAIFHTDQHPSESNYQLTLSGFSTNLTTCQPRCGDSVISGSEECDCGDGNGAMPDGCTGKNDDHAYGGCTTSCKYGAYCGDGHTDSDNGEVCDDGPNNGASYSTSATSGCTYTCQRPHFCGDAHLDPQEECDQGENNGKSGIMCGSDCKRVIG